MKRYRYIVWMMAVLLMMGGMVNEAWAAKVTYHILTLPIDSTGRYNYHMVKETDGKRLEAFKITVDQTTVELPAHYKSPLAKDFCYFEASSIVTDGKAIKLYNNGATKGILYEVKASPDTIREGTAITKSTAEYYVTYTYNESNGIAKLDGTQNYNIGVYNKGFLSLNRGRNNRPAIVPTAKVNAKILSERDFSYIDNPGAGITTYWQSGDNKNRESDTKSKFFFVFKFEGKDPYHLVIRTSYAKDSTYIEKNDNIKPDQFVYKWYKEGSLFAVGTANAYIASDENILYNKRYDSETYPNPTDLTKGTGTGYIDMFGNFHGQTKVPWTTFALLNNNNSTGFVLMGTRTVDDNGATPASPYYIKFSNNNLNFGQITAADASKNHWIDGIYPVRKITFKIPTPFYKVSATSDHLITAIGYVSEYSVETAPIETRYLPDSLNRKYVNFTGKYYKDAACTREITKFSEADFDEGGEGYQVYVGYETTDNIPFKAITPAATYSASTWAKATWYELTDEGSTQENGRKLECDGTNFKNNGADGDYKKQSEFAFIGDPYELYVVYRNATSGATVNYVGAAGTPPATGTALTVSESVTEGYKWEIPDDEPEGSFLLRKYKDTNKGHWSWDAGHPDPVTVSYTTKAHTYNVAKANAQTLTFNVTDLGYTEGDYIKVTAGGTNADQVSVTTEKIYVQSNGTASFTASIKARGGGDKQFTLSIKRYEPDNDPYDEAVSVITVNQNNPAVVESTVTYNTASSTRMKVMELPKRKFTYKIVDKSGKISVKATAMQTIFSTLTAASLPEIIISPYLYGETVTFYTTYTGGGRGNLSSQITELPAGNATRSTEIYVKYTTSALDAKPIRLNENEQFNVRLYGQYLYYDKTDDVIKSKASPTAAELESSNYLWKLRGRDPYAMLIDNMAAREDLGASGTESVDVYDDNGVSTSQLRQVGAWVHLASIANEGALTFSKVRAEAQRFVAKSSLQTGVYEVMVADSGKADADTTYYNIGCPEPNTVNIYNNSTYAHGNDVLRFILNQNVAYVYHLIDTYDHQLLAAENKTPDLALPAEYQSPLVATYTFYAKDQMVIDTSKKIHTYKPRDGATTLSKITDLDAEFTVVASNSTEWGTAPEDFKKTATDSTDMISQVKVLTTTGDYYFNINNGAMYKKVPVTQGNRGRDIYVKYVANDIVKFNTGAYMLRFLEPLAEGYYLEDGNDKLTTEQIQAVYPYCNGDGSLNIYGNDMQKEQFNGGASTRPRWVWYFDSEKSDPYHVRIRSKSTINSKNVKHYTYLTTQAVHFTQDADPNTKHIVTGGGLPSVATVEPTQYMVLGSVGHYRLLTTDSIDDGTTKQRCLVDSLEQYWKTYNMIKLHVLNVDASTDAYSEDTTTWVVPKTNDPATLVDESTFRATLAARGWHSYKAYANATRWNGYSDKSDGHEKKVVENIEHWFQTFKMGNGTFDIESADIPPVMVLLDRHGWEIMRRPLPTTTYPEGEELDALRVYDSPLVDKYYFYSNATKASGCHRYTMRLDDKGKERDQVTVNGTRFSSTSLGDLPPRSAKGVVSSGAIQDLYVIYTVKEEYEKNYLDSVKFNDVDSTYTDSIVCQPYLVLQNARFYKNYTNDEQSYFTKPIFEHSNPTGGNVYDMIISPQNNTVNIIKNGNFIGNIFWYIKPNPDIDDEMGIPWMKATGESTVAKAKYVLKKEYKEKGQIGFDPYNIQLQILKDNNGDSLGHFITTHADSVRLDNGIMVGYYDNGGTTNITLTAKCASPVTDEGYDHTTMRVTNQTFMAVSDANGNMQLMPRFDHTKRVDLKNANPWHTILSEPVNHAKASPESNSSMGPQTTFFVTPQRFHYHIIDNNGREALGYKRGADFHPTITDHFKSPVAKDFTFYSGLAQKTADSTSCLPGAWGAATGEYKRTLSKESMFNDAIKLLPDTGWYYFRIGTRGNFKWRKIHIKKGLNEQQITGSFADAHVNGVDPDVYVRYDYDLDADLDADRMLQGQWYTIQLAGEDIQASGDLTVSTDATCGTGVRLFKGTKPGTIDSSTKGWQWKFFVAPADTSSDYYVKPDPYAIHMFNRQSNYTRNPSDDPSPMSVGIKVPYNNTGVDRFALLSHPGGGYALAVAKAYDNNYRYQFLNGTGITAPDAGSPVPADTAYEAGFNYKAGEISAASRLVLNDDVVHSYVYRVLNNDSIFAVEAKQNNADARSHDFAPYLPDSAQSPLLNMDDYLYYGFIRPFGGKKGVIEQTKLYTLSGLYDDTVYVRYKPYDVDKTSYKVPNKRNDTGTGQVARHSESVDASLNITGELPYNIIWFGDNMMKSADNTTINGDGSQHLSGNTAHVWYIKGGDPYALKIRHTKTGKFLDGTATMVENEADAKTFMLLRKTDYEYGILQVTGITGADAGKKLTGFGGALTPNVATSPTKYIIFGLSIHDLIYHLIIANTCPDKDHPKDGQYVDIKYRATESDDLTTKRIFGTTQRDLKTKKNETHLEGSMYQLGDTVKWNGTYHTYSYHAGSVSIGDDLVLPNIFTRPNCTFDFYIEGVYKHAPGDADDDEPITAMNNKYQGLKLTKLMSDEELIDQTVVVNIVYTFDNEVATNTGLGFVTDTAQNLWYTFETHESTTPYLAQYTNAWGLQSKQGRDTRYTNDYLWTPLGDVYGFKMYNRYMLRNNAGGKDKVMTVKAFAENDTLRLAEPGKDGYTAGYEIFELIPGDVDGYFRVHSVPNNGATTYYVWRDPSDNYTKLSTTPCDWRYGLDITLLEPYYERAGYVGGLNATGKAAYENARDNGKIIDIQNVVYDDANIIRYTPGYYRMHNQPEVSGISPVRYASGYLHDIEKTAVSGGIPMHFFSKQGITATFAGAEDGLDAGFTETHATWGEIPIDSTEVDPSTIFYIPGGIDIEDPTDSINPRVTIQTQGLYVAANANGDANNGKTNSKQQRAVMSENAGNAITFSLMDIGGAVLLIHDGEEPAVRRYLNYDQTKADSIYDLKYYHNTPTDDAKWCLQPVQKTATAGDGEMPLRIVTNNGGDGYYYATFYAPFDVLLPADDGGKTYNAYTCSQWYNDGVHPTPVPAVSTYAEGKFVPAETPVIIRVKDESGELTLTLPSTSPSPRLSCVFQGKYLEQLLALDAAHDVYTLGLPMISTVTKDDDYSTTGDISAPLPDFATSGVGFYINATRNKEDDPLKSLWQRNNRYVLHNKIYYRETGGAPGAPANRGKVDFVPVLFGDEQPDDPNENGGNTSKSGIYDLLGRKLTTLPTTPGVYIVDGKKIYVQ